jgi:hypothetical protein
MGKKTTHDDSAIEVDNLLLESYQWVDELCPRSIESGSKPLRKAVDTAK